MMCQDCDKREAEEIVFDDEKKNHLALCRECIKEQDHILGSELIRKFQEEE